LIALIQRVSEASVTVEGRPVGRIGPGVLALVGVERDDTEAEVDRMLERILGYRVFQDDEGRMNLSLGQTGGGLLLVPQFTLAADTKKGMRASFGPAAEPEQGRRLFGQLLDKARRLHPEVATGVFGAHMKVRLENDGPVTFWLQAKPATPRERQRGKS
jgi:D-tyrosyl-tRNA(Tyr) deacylase